MASGGQDSKYHTPREGIRIDFPKETPEPCRDFMNNKCYRTYCNRIHIRDHEFKSIKRGLSDFSDEIKARARTFHSLWKEEERVRRLAITKKSKIMETRICLRFLHDNCFTTDCAFVHPKTGQELPDSDFILVTVNLGPVLLSLKKMVMEETFEDDDPDKEKASNDTQAGVYRIHYMRPFKDLMKNIRHRIQVKQFIDDKDDSA